MASISRRTVDGNSRYDVNYREPGGRRRRKTSTKRADADAFIASVEADKLRGAYIDRDAGRITFKAYAEEWLANQPFTPSTREQVALRLRLHMYPVLGTHLVPAGDDRTRKALDSAFVCYMSATSGSSGNGEYAA